MKKKILRVIIAALGVTVLVLSLGISVAAAGNGAGNGNNGTAQVSPLTAEETDWLLFMREEEKLARDVYLELYDIWQMPVFINIAESEQRHTDAVEKLLDKYDLEDPVVDENIRGGFTDAELDDMYHALLDKGSLSLVDALEVGVMIEETDIVDLEDALGVTNHVDIERVYTNLLDGSLNHLDAFNSHLD